MKLPLAIALAAVMCSCGPDAVDSTREAAQIRRIEALEAKVQALEKRADTQSDIIDMWVRRMDEIERSAPSAKREALIEELGFDFRSKATDYIIEIARDCAGTPQEESGKESALFHAERLERCGFLKDITPEKMVDGFFSAMKAQKSAD